MIEEKKVIVVLPAYNAAKTLEKTVSSIPPGIADEIILVDDASQDETVKKALEMGLRVVTHDVNSGYGANQKTCYKAALEQGADIVIMLHPDYQYDPRLVPVMAYMVASGLYDVVLGSRILGRDALQGGMPRYKYYANRFLTLVENILTGQKLSEYHTGYRAFSREVIEHLPFENNSNDFVFDNQILIQCFYAGFKVGEISCPTKYFPEASSINFIRSVQYGFGVLKTALDYKFHCLGAKRAAILADIKRNAAHSKGEND